MSDNSTELVTSMTIRRYHPIPYKQYRRLAQVIHDNFCESDVCNYGHETKEMREHDTEVLRVHVAEDHQFGCSCSMQLKCYSCQFAVGAENIAARVQLNISGKVVIR